ncbi:MAG TPA: Spy/CpxP family protein refolding chaperone [Burkholderiales bacterium]|nr:Spy/CpxP family protein refolding chaperone [Burkholderiales bacterium]
MKSKPMFSSKISYAIGALASVIVLASAVPTYANEKAPQGAKCGHHFHKDGKRGDRSAMMQKRLDKLKAELKIQPNQENAWGTYAVKAKEQGEKMKSHHQQAQANTTLTLPEQLDQRNAFMKQRQASMEDMAVTLKALYAQLTPEQRTVMDKHFSHRERRHGRG